MAKKVVMQSRGVRYHDVQKSVEAFIFSEQKSAVIGNVKWTEWRNKDSCKCSFRRAIKKLGYQDRINIALTNDGRIKLFYNGWVKFA